nr:MAG TPA: hypothetical protein [Caudoviricetes sp.]
MTYKMILLPKSSNAKTGDVIQSYSSSSYCPKSCALKGQGCYAEQFHTKLQWDRCKNPQDPRYVDNFSDLMEALTTEVSLREKSQDKPVLFRHNVAGDMAIEGTSILDSSKVYMVAHAIEAVNQVFPKSLVGYTYTHCRLDWNSIQMMLDVKEKGFIINASCEYLAEVVHAKDYGINAVITSVDPEETKKEIAEKGIKSVQCPAQTHDGMTCDKCRICAGDRAAVVIFKVHGIFARKARKVIMMKTGKVA